MRENVSYSERIEILFISRAPIQQLSVSRGRTGKIPPLDLMTVNHRQPFRLKLERDKVTSLYGNNIRPRILPRDAAIEQEQETRHTAEIHRFGTVSGRGRGWQPAIFPARLAFASLRLLILLPSSHFAPSSHSIRIMNPMTNRLLTVLPLT